MNKTVTTPIVAILVLVFVGAGFYGGMQYQKNQTSVIGGNGAGQLGQFGGHNGQGRGGNRGAGFVSGDIIKQDASSITISLQAGGSKTVYLGASSTVGKFVEGAASDLQVGQRVMVNGTPNADGSVVAQTIQIRPQLRQGSAGQAQESAK